MNSAIKKVILMFVLFVLCILDLFPYEVIPYFNSPEYNHSLKQVIINHIDQAIDNISISAYSFDDPDIANSLINASLRGVKVRMIVDSDYWNNLIDYIDSYENIEVYSDLKLKGYAKNSRQHHSKFLVLDYDVPLSPVKNTVVTGSYNFTLSSSTMAYNNLLVVKDNADVANMYIQEFNEEWGSSGFQFNPSYSRIGKEKRDPPPYFHSSENEEVYFSYSDKNKIKNRLIELINTSENVLICMYSFSTNSDVFDVVLQNVSNKPIYGVFDSGQGMSYFSAYRVLVEKKPENFAVENEYKVLHNKYLILNYDENDLTKGIIVTGSYNLSKNSEENNEENIIIVKNNSSIVKSYVKDFLYHFTKTGKVINWINLPSYNPTNIISRSLATNFIEGKNLNKIVSLILSNENKQDYLGIISNMTNRVYFQIPNVEGIFNVVAILENGDRDVLPCYITVVSSNTLILVNDGNKGLRPDEPIKVRVFSFPEEIPYLEVEVNNIKKYFLLTYQGGYYFCEFYLDTIAPLNTITNGTPIILKYKDTYSTNILYLPPLSFHIQVPQKIVKNSYVTINIVLNDRYNRKVKLSGNANVPLDIKSSGEISFFTGDNSQIDVFITVEDEIGYSFSEYLQIPVISEEKVFVYPTHLRLGQKIYIEGSFESLHIFDKSNNKVYFSIGEDNRGRYIVPFLNSSNILFLVIEKGGKREIRKVIVSEF